MARMIARGLGSGGAVAWQRLLPLAGGTVLLLLGLFCAWQAWLIASESGGVAEVHAAQDTAVRALATEIAGEHKQVAQAVASLDPATLPGDRAQLADALRARLPQALDVEVYSAGLDEVLHANYRDFGYAKAAQLMAAQAADDSLPVQTVAVSGQRRLSLVQPLGPLQRPQAWIWVELPFTPLQRRFESIAPGSGRIDLRQGDDRGELSLLSHGASSAEAEEKAEPVPGSTFSVRAALPAA